MGLRLCPATIALFALQTAAASAGRAFCLPVVIIHSTGIGQLDKTATSTEHTRSIALGTVNMSITATGLAL
ncbi:MAG: hypothetical protein WCR20_07590 [Verrucomicrobiota bacterium]|nr:hypothetical protein [Verrucomicrobiota bacterium]